MTFYPLIPLWTFALLLPLVAVATFYAFKYRNPAVTASRHRLLVALRVASLILVVFMLLCPGQMIEERNLEKSQIVFWSTVPLRWAHVTCRMAKRACHAPPPSYATRRCAPLRLPRALYAFHHDTDRSVTRCFVRPDS